MTTTSRRTFLRHSLATGSALALAPVGGCSLLRSAPLDLVLRGGTVIDGTGKAGFEADVGVRGDRIVAIGKLDHGAGQVIDARGLIVAPGFVDAHAHTDLRRNPRAQSKLFQGVTMDVTGPDGGSPFPTPLSTTEAATVDDEAACASFAAWADEHGPIAMNIGAYVGHGTVRKLVLGPVGRAPDARELGIMKDLVAQAFEQGALGLSSGLEYFPGNMSTTAELVELCRIAARFDRPYVTHIRNEDETLLEAVDEAIEICRRSGAPLLLSHLKVGGAPNWHKIDALLQRIEQARAAGLEVRCDRYPYEAWSTGLATNFPGWAKEGGHFVERLQDPAERARMRAETERAVAANGGWGALMLGGGLGSGDRDLVGRRVDEVAVERGREPFEVACELLTHGSVSILGFGMSEDNMDRILTRTYCMIASDGSAVTAIGAAGRGTHPRSYGTFPRAFRRYVRELRLLTAEEFVRKATSLPAATLRLSDRGVLAAGKLADVVVFDAERFTDPATYLQPQQYGQGVRHLIIGGRLAVTEGALTEAMAGRVVRA
ncbi:MAG: D-aminoacylase [Planctomycetes bacterium]|nr:D-aminoacylase [Planctomycetota bacterium]